ncbi:MULTISPECIES: hypothetical protein [unclassified Crossiella]|uniref:hypothetical protein n=1 Tax=unclassified Crossiella TaxID=2620835 RepID=UPI001FFFCE23|nr:MULTISPECIES: hypothetical protein [unclassified Crossiella]MCK2240541.1 hypothetical protein [Crossiella sp. S99.2]MCK2253008.1 hypothetical protein [Crossiella sp. S99.1]
MGIVSKRVTAALLGAAAVGGVLLPGATAVAAPAQLAASQSPASIAAAQGIKIDVFTNTVDITTKIYGIVADAIKTHQNRGGYVKSLMEGGFYDARERYNVLVIKADHPYDVNLQGKVYDARVHSDAYPDFHIYVFDSGTVVNRGDGGWINWAFRGWFDRPGNGGTVNFHKP